MCGGGLATIDARQLRGGSRIDAEADPALSRLDLDRPVQLKAVDGDSGRGCEGHDHARGGFDTKVLAPDIIPRMEKRARETRFAINGFHAIRLEHVAGSACERPTGFLVETTATRRNDVLDFKREVEERLGSATVFATVPGASPPAGNADSWPVRPGRRFRTPGARGEFLIDKSTQLGRLVGRQRRSAVARGPPAPHQLVQLSALLRAEMLVGSKPLNHDE